MPGSDISFAQILPPCPDDSGDEATSQGDRQWIDMDAVDATEMKVGVAENKKDLAPSAERNLPPSPPSCRPDVRYYIDVDLNEDADASDGEDTGNDLVPFAELFPSLFPPSSRPIHRHCIVVEDSDAAGGAEDGNDLVPDDATGSKSTDPIDECRVNLAASLDLRTLSSVNTGVPEPSESPVVSEATASVASIGELTTAASVVSSDEPCTSSLIIPALETAAADQRGKTGDAGKKARKRHRSPEGSCGSNTTRVLSTSDGQQPRHLAHKNRAAVGATKHKKAGRTATNKTPIGTQLTSATDTLIEPTQSRPSAPLIATVLAAGKDPFAILSCGTEVVTRGSTTACLRRVFLMLAARVHPDKNRGCELDATDAFQRVVEAHESAQAMCAVPGPPPTSSSMSQRAPRGKRSREEPEQETSSPRNRHVPSFTEAHAEIPVGACTALRSPTRRVIDAIDASGISDRAIREFMGSIEPSTSLRLLWKRRPDSADTEEWLGYTKKRGGRYTTVIWTHEFDPEHPNLVHEGRPYDMLRDEGGEAVEEENSLPTSPDAANTSIIVRLEALEDLPSSHLTRVPCEAAGSSPTKSPGDVADRRRRREKK